MSIVRAIAITLLLALPASAETVRVGAAISLKDALGDVAKAYEADTGDKLEFSFGSSGQVMAQVKNGADVDLFISAAAKQVDDLQKDGLVDAASRRIVAANTLVLIVPAGANDAPASFEALAGPGVMKVATGEPKTVPAGQYAEQVFKSLKLADKLSGRLVYGTNVRQVLAYVERGEVSAGVVYATDARESGDKVRVVATAPSTAHDPIVYPGVVVTASKRPAAAKRFLDFLGSPKARTAFKAKGFGVVDDAAATRPAGALLSVEGEVAKPLSLSAEALSKLPRKDVKAKDHGGVEATYSGVPMRAVLLEAGVPLGQHRMRGENLSRYLVVVAADGYRAVFALPEFDEEFAERNILLADRKDGKPLDAKEGPLRVIVPGEALPARWVRQVVSLKVAVAPK